MKRVLILRHGIALNRWVLRPMERYFRRHGYIVDNRSYPSTRKHIADLAKDLAGEMREIARSFEPATEPVEYYAIGHSMGGLVIRYALTHFETPPVRRAVLIGTPNQGAARARFYKNFFLYRWIFGTKAGWDLAHEPHGGIFVEAGVPPSTEIGTIAGSVGWRLLPGKLAKPHDAIVSVEEVRFPPSPLIVVPHEHVLMLFSSRVWREAEHFLEQGRFIDGSA
jgi:pimeloyl-ACP methyl ester carboxylesterase